MISTSDESIDDDFDVVLVMLAKNGSVAQINDFSVDAGSQISAFQQVFEQIAKLALLILHNRSEDLIFRPCGLTEQTVDNLIS